MAAVSPKVGLDVNTIRGTIVPLCVGRIYTAFWGRGTVHG
jgi:hypothetical protein